MEYYYNRGLEGAIGCNEEAVEILDRLLNLNRAQFQLESPLYLDRLKQLSQQIEYYSHIAVQEIQNDVGKIKARLDNVVDRLIITRQKSTAIIVAAGRSRARRR